MSRTKLVFGAWVVYRGEDEVIGVAAEKLRREYLSRPSIRYGFNIINSMALYYGRWPDYGHVRLGPPLIGFKATAYPNILGLFIIRYWRIRDWILVLKTKLGRFLLGLMTGRGE